MATPIQFLELASGASGVLTGLASVPSGADNAIVRVDSGTARWSQTTGSWLTASVGLLISAADPPIRLDSGGALRGTAAFGSFKFYPMGGGAAIMAAYYAYEARPWTL